MQQQYCTVYGIPIPFNNNMQWGSNLESVTLCSDILTTHLTLCATLKVTLTFIIVYLTYQAQNLPDTPNLQQPRNQLGPFEHGAQPNVTGNIQPHFIGLEMSNTDMH